MFEWVIWGILLVLQNASHTATSRSRNSKSLWYTGVASIFSNGIWFASQFYIVNKLIQVKDDPVMFVGILVYYVALTALGSVGAQWYLMKFEKRKGIERG